MLVIQIFGAILVAAGLALFAYDQIKGSRAKGDYAGLQAFKLQVGGPPALILIVIGVIVFMFPFTPWIPEDDPPQISTTTTGTTLPPTTTTTVLGTTTTTFTLETLGPIFTLLTIDPPVFTVVPVLPLAPDSWDWYFDANCGDVIFWDASAGADSYYIEVFVDDYNGNYISDFTYDWFDTEMCTNNFVLGPGYVHALFITPVNNNGMGDSLFLEWFT